MNERIEGRVARVLSERELVINRGAHHDVREGMRFAVLAASPIEVIDPETDEIIDVIDREKVRVEAVEVRDKSTICATYEAQWEGGGGLNPFFAAQALGNLFEQRRKVIKTLRIEDSDLPGPLDPKESFVKKNDRVVEIRPLPDPE
jgi:hypothetical protein